jgi:hypothetical protein
MTPHHPKNDFKKTAEGTVEAPTCYCSNIIVLIIDSTLLQLPVLLKYSSAAI